MDIVLLSLNWTDSGADENRFRGHFPGEKLIESFIVQDGPWKHISENILRYPYHKPFRIKALALGDPKAWT